MTENERKNFFESLARPAIRGLEPYDASTIESPEIRLSANENNEGVPRAALEAMRAALKEGNRYPDSRNGALREKLAARFAVRAEQIITSNGLDGFFTMLGRAFLDPGDEVICSECTFGVYADTARIAGATVKKVALNESWEQEPASFAAAVSPASKMLFFCNPNNPTGTLAPADELRGMLRAIPQRVIVVLDEAYIDFTEEDTTASFKMLEEFPNLIICRTFSKIFALAGLRVGWAAADPGLLDCLYRVREPYCVTAAAEAGAIAAAEAPEETAAAARRCAREREKLCALFAERGLRFIPSLTNFILVFPGEKYEKLATAFAGASIAVRSLAPRGERAMRISVGTPKENRRVEEVVRNVLS
ncbi:MAG: histidinol-phosphate transaminase [Synergistaceae bacterium]|nr:histidinol-phosphate transaminase [Synergistaceae bacterium]